MVEGGAHVIKSFLAEPNTVNTIIITIAPSLVGSEGVGYGSDLTSIQARPLFYTIPFSGF